MQLRYTDHVPDGIRMYFGYRNELSTQDGLVFREDRILVPHVLRRKLIDSCHASHNGIEATLRLACANLFWPGMTSQIKDVVKGCAVCEICSVSAESNDEDTRYSCVPVPAYFHGRLFCRNERCQAHISYFG